MDRRGFDWHGNLPSFFHDNEPDKGNQRAQNKTDLKTTPQPLTTMNDCRTHSVIFYFKAGGAFSFEFSITDCQGSGFFFTSHDSRWLLGCWVGWGLWGRFSGCWGLDRKISGAVISGLEPLSLSHQCSIRIRTLDWGMAHYTLFVDRASTVFLSVLS